MPVELRQLRYLVTLSETGNFARAAEREHITQSALSQQIARLERELRVDLFERTSRGTRPTRAGAVVLARAQAVLREVNRLADEATSLAQGFAGLLRVGSPTYGFSSAGRRGVLAAVADPLRDVDIRFENDWSPLLVQRLLNRELDLTFAMQGEPHPDLDLLLVQDSPALLVLPERHPLAALPAVGPGDLRDALVLLYPHDLNPWMFEGMAEPLRAAGARIGAVRETALPAVLDEVRAENAVFPAVPWEIELMNPGMLGGLAIRPASREAGLRYSLWLARRQGDVSPLVDAFWVAAEQAVKCHGPLGFQS